MTTDSDDAPGASAPTLDDDVVQLVERALEEGRFVIRSSNLMRLQEMIWLLIAAAFLVVAVISLANGNLWGLVIPGVTVFLVRQAIKAFPQTVCDAHGVTLGRYRRHSGADPTPWTDVERFEVITVEYGQGTIHATCATLVDGTQHETGARGGRKHMTRVALMAEQFRVGVTR